MKQLTKIIIAMLFSLCSPNYTQAQNALVKDILYKAMDIYDKKFNGGKFKGQILKGSINGMGVVQYSDGSFYFGDFKDDKITGYGMYVSFTGKNLPESVCVYLGDWSNGKKHGTGYCYDKDGNLAYMADFKNGKLTEKIECPSNRTFTIKELRNDTYYIGEVKDYGTLDGFGMLVLAGRLYISQFKNNTQVGVGLLIESWGDWMIFNYNNGNANFVSSSERYNQIDEARKANYKAILKEDFGDILSVLQFTAQGLLDAANNASQLGNINTYAETDTGGSRSSISSNGKCPDCQGSGKCEGAGKPSARYHCRGTKKCQYCNGDGTKYITGTKDVCDVCKGSTICKFCHGSGKCMRCGGTGK